MDFVGLFLLNFFMVITPGPNNAMLSASGTNYGYKKTLPHIWGIMIGFPFLGLMMCLGVGNIIRSFPAVKMILTVSGGLYLLYLAWRIAFSNPVPASSDTEKDEKKSNSRPLRFWEAFLFQWINIKGVLANMSLAALFLKEISVSRVLGFVSVEFLNSILSTHIWTFAGIGIGKILRTPKQLRIFNGVMGFLLALFGFLIFFGNE